MLIKYRLAAALSFSLLAGAGAVFAADLDTDQDGIPDSIDMAPQNNRLPAALSLFRLHGDGPQWNWFGPFLSSAGIGDVDGDGVPDIAISSPYDYPDPADVHHVGAQGSVRIFSGKTRQALYTVYGDSIYKPFGEFVAAAGDIDADGFKDFMVGVGGHAQDLGHVMLYSGKTGQLIRVLGRVAGQSLGGHAAALGDINGDGYDDVIAAYGQGAIAYSGHNGQILYQYAVSRLNFYAMGVRPVGDINADGFVDVALTENYGNLTTGNDVYLVSGKTGTELIWLGDNFYWQFVDVDTLGDINNDGYDDFAVSSPGDDTKGQDAGAVKIFSGHYFNLIRTIYGNTPNLYFGRVVRGCSDADQDGKKDVLVDVGGGRFVVYSSVTGLPLISFANNDTNFLLDVVGDLDGDGYDEFMASNPSLSVLGDVQFYTVGDAAQKTSDTDGDGQMDIYDRDDENDGMPDLWEYRYALDQHVDDSAADPDGDTLTNLEEFHLGNSPVSINSDGDHLDDDVDPNQSGYSPAETMQGLICYSYSYPRYTSAVGDINGDGVTDFVAGSNLGVEVFDGKDCLVLYELSGADPEDHFGDAVSGGGDVDGDGTPDILIGAYAASATGTERGVAYVYSGANGTLIRSLQGLADYDHFGAALSNAGDVDNDGFADVLVGAPNDNRGAAGAGSATVFSGKTGLPLRTMLGSEVNEAIGAGALASAGDIDQDGFADFLVGSKKVNGGSGSVRVVSGQTGSVIHLLQPMVSGAWFGASVGVISDVDNDGYTDIIVGAPQEIHTVVQPDSSTLDIKSGSVRLFSGQTGAQLSLIQVDIEGAQLGEAVGNAGDIDGDGFDDFMMSERLSGESGYNVSMRFYSGKTLAYLDGALSLVGPMGYSPSGVALGDVNADGFDDVLLGPYLRLLNGVDLVACCIDTDADGVMNNKDIDDDNDGVQDIVDLFPRDPLESADTDLDHVGDNADMDDDGDGITDAGESVAGTDPFDADTDDDGTVDSNDAFPLDPAEQGDPDGDGVGDNVDNCRAVANSGQQDSNGNGFGDACEITHTGSVTGQLATAALTIGDVNLDGLGDVVLCEPKASVTVNGGDVLKNAGKATVFSGADGSVLLAVEGRESSVGFCSSVAVTTPAGSDPGGNLLIGSPYHNKSLGKVSLYSGSTGNFIADILEGEKAGDLFGAALAVYDDILAVGMPGHKSYPMPLGESYGRHLVAAKAGGVEFFLLPNYGSLGEVEGQYPKESLGSSLSVSWGEFFAGSPNVSVRRYINGRPKTMKQAGAVREVWANGPVASSQCEVDEDTGWEYCDLGASITDTGFMSGDRLGASLGIGNFRAIGSPGSDLYQYSGAGKETLLKDAGFIGIIDWEGRELYIMGTAAGDRMGATMASGDINGDGIADIVYLQPGYDSDAQHRDVGLLHVLSGRNINALLKD